MAARLGAPRIPVRAASCRTGRQGISNTNPVAIGASALTSIVLREWSCCGTPVSEGRRAIDPGLHSRGAATRRSAVRCNRQFWRSRAEARQSTREEAWTSSDAHYWSIQWLSGAAGMQTVRRTLRRSGGRVPLATARARRRAQLPPPAQVHDELPDHTQFTGHQCLKGKLERFPFLILRGWERK